MKLARYQPAGIWFPTEIISRREIHADGKWQQAQSTNVQRVKAAWFAIGPYVPGAEEAEEEEEPGYEPPTVPPQSSPRLPQATPPPAELPPTAEPKAADGAARQSKATRAVGLLDPEGVSRLESSCRQRPLVNVPLAGRATRARQRYAWLNARGFRLRPRPSARVVPLGPTAHKTVGPFVT